MSDPKEISKEIRRARKWINHYSQWKNEPVEARKLRRWQRRLRRALKAALEAGAEVELDPDAPSPPPPPPPPPPTPEEILAQQISELRLVLPWEAFPGTAAWAAWGATGWTAVRIISSARIRGRASRVDPRTGEILGERTVRLDRLVARDPALAGKDKPVLTPTQIWTEEQPEHDEPRRASYTRPWPPLLEEGESRVTHLIEALGDDLIEALGDDATVEDW